jgi:hypothetical protein
VLADYPVRVRTQAVGKQKYVAQIVNWWVISGWGDTPAEAIADLNRALRAWMSRGEPLPRPGVHVPLRFAASGRVDAYADVAQRFLREVVRTDPGTTFLSNQSSLWYFTSTDTIEPLQLRIREVFGVDVSDIEDGSLVRIFERIDRLSTDA